ncbi:ABC transporter ATP-binding protein [Phreatobacter aquaticus]|uniref:ABC transporter ATP-binding protein n=1 Tax=Phreatobacter aquaticus TaxID=2570229 RepID=A0A4D7QPG3_9HYPH|nr:ABC transporter ATP-binding protein [Phreatobacter aquaticus]QCK87813.1 ABC transporter ATP-binding protein [Phreatobacter aquaticus]
MARIRLDGVTKNYGSVTALQKLDLDIRDREFMVFLGPSGCGKTTTLNIIAGLEEISEGDIWFDDRKVTFIPPHKREIAMVFQSYALYPQKSVFDNIAFGLRLRGEDQASVDAKVKAAAEQLEITHLLDRKPHQLSGGQRQRVALGRALVRQPSVFLMDEPLSNLDAALRVSMRSLIKKLHLSMGTTFVYVTHDQAEALTLADRITVMRDGVVQQLDTPDVIYNRPANRFVASFLGSPQMNFVEGELVDDPGGPTFVRGDFQLAVDPALAAGQGGRKVVLGLRAEDAILTGEGSGLAGAVTLVSPLGSEQHIDLSVAGVDLVVRASKDQSLAIGDRLSLAVEPARLHLFDATSEQRLASAS